MSFRPADLVEMLRARAAATPEATAYILLEEDGSERRLTYGELDVRARATAAAMQQSGAAGGRALLLYPPGEEYVVGFFGCLYSGTAAVPVYPPSGKRGLDRLMDIVTDAEATVALTDDSTLQLVTAMGDALGDLGKLAWTATDTVARDAAPSWAEVAPGGEALAFLQYTSGSTGTPKGVMVSHANLIAQLRVDPPPPRPRTDSVGVSLAAAVPRHGPHRRHPPARSTAASRRPDGAASTFLQPPVPLAASRSAGTAARSAARPTSPTTLCVRADHRRASARPGPQPLGASPSTAPSRSRRHPRPLRRDSSAPRASAAAPSTPATAWPRPR